MASNRIDLSEALWIKSSHSNGSGGECVEVARNVPGIAPVRDSKVPGSLVVVLGHGAWGPFVEALKAL